MTIATFKVTEAEKIAPIISQQPSNGDCFLLSNTKTHTWSQYNGSIIMRIYNGWILLDKPGITWIDMPPGSLASIEVRGWPITQLNIEYKVEK